MRWWALFGSAGTLSLSLCCVVGYYNLLDQSSDANGYPRYSIDTRLDVRADRAASDAAQPVPRYLSEDWVARRPWIGRYTAQYALGVDGISLSLAVLTAIVTFLAIAASWKIEQSVRGYLMLVLFLETGVLGAFLALDFLLFYFFYELMLLPMFVLIGLWGGGRRRYAALKFVIYTLIGSVGLLVAMIGLFTVNVRDFVDQAEVKQRAIDLRKVNAGMTEEAALERVEVHTFDFVTLSKVGRAVMLILNGQEDRLGTQNRFGEVPASADSQGSVRLFAPGVKPEAAIARLKAQSVCTKWFQYTFFALLFLGFAVKVPIVPLHSWLPDAHVEAPTPISMILAGVLLEARRLRPDSRRLPDLSLGCGRTGVVGGTDRRGRHRLWRARRHGPDRLQEAPGLFLGQPHGVRGARPGGLGFRSPRRILAMGRERRGVPDAGPRHHGFRAVLRRRRGLRPGSPSQREPVWRTEGADAALLPASAPSSSSPRWDCRACAASWVSSSCCWRHGTSRPRWRSPRF